MDCGQDVVLTDSPTRVIDSSERSSEARSARVTDTSDRDGRAIVTSSPPRVIDSSERSSEPLEDQTSKEVQSRRIGAVAVLSKEEFGHQSFMDKASLYDHQDFPTSS